jgi:hypothetical protein
MKNRKNCPILVLLVEMNFSWAWRSHIKSFYRTDNPFKRATACVYFFSKVKMMEVLRRLMPLSQLLLHPSA